ncbi:MAG: tRNA (N6-isopentenyl adenosine(37)-C2)-methylthiotransferase MiaB [Alphaproteobacteria bacterium]|nr:tRNA (N6-isopentenyl adenosine(37)-C2)-methylthiotransferase MiaB [Alphaproteobacteria bacterium]
MKVFIKTYGCQMNAYDSRRMLDVLKPLGYEAADSPEGADMVILNTCHIREKAEEKVYSELGRVRQEKERQAQEGRRMLIAVAGCVAQAEGEEILARAPFVDMVFGPQSYHRLPELVTKALRARGSAVNLEFPSVSKFDFLPESVSGQGAAAFLAVQEGCDKFCTFCVVPYTRGGEYSRSVAEVEREARLLAEQGAVEIMLLGQNVNAYHGAGPDGEAWTLAALIRRLARIDGLRRIRYTTSHPRDMSDDLISAHAEEEKLMPYLHLPIQSGSDAVLERMNRKHNRAFYLDIIARLRRARPDMAFSGDFIVGFPRETEEDFAATLSIVREVGYATAYSFSYSPRPGTPAASEEHQVPPEVKDARLQRLQAEIGASALAFNQGCIGRVMEVLLDRDGRRPGQLLGRSPYMQSVHVEGAESYRGKIVSVKIANAYANSMAGKLIHFRQRAA